MRNVFELSRLGGRRRDGLGLPNVGVLNLAAIQGQLVLQHDIER
jgi:hypothetical protein